MTKIEFREDPLEAGQSLREALWVKNPQNESVISVGLTNGVIDASSEVANHFSQVHGSTSESKTCGAQGELQLNPSFTSTKVYPKLQNILEDVPPITPRVHAVFSSETPTKVATGNTRPNNIPLFVIVPNLTNAK